MLLFIVIVQLNYVSIIHNKYLMLKLSSKSLTIYQSGELKQHLEKLVQKSQQIVNQKLQRQFEKQARVEAVERQFVQWAGKKENQIKEKLQKSTKNKQEHISKIVKKCKQHEKFLGEKLKKYQNKRKANLRQAWKLSEKYKSHFEHQSSNNVSNDKSIPKIKNTDLLSQSQFKQNQLLPPQKQQVYKQYQQPNYGNPSLLKVHGNITKDYWGELNQSVRQIRVPGQQNYQNQTQFQKGEKQKNRVEEKLKETFARFKQNSLEEQRTKIQQLGQRLQKIEKSRIRKMELVKRKRQKTQNTIQDQDPQVEKKKQQKDKYRSQRMHSQTIMREKRVHNWSEVNKNKRQYEFQMQLQNGTNYLQSQKMKYLKASLAKKITLSAIEKKLYFQRLNH